LKSLRIFFVAFFVLLFYTIKTVQQSIAAFFITSIKEKFMQAITATEATKNIKVLVSGDAHFMKHALALTTGYVVKSTLHTTAENENDEFTEFAEYVLEGTRDDIDSVDIMLQQIAAFTEAEEAYGGELGEIN
tara:strand:- start:265 stop:663 length:399 start_codon:yes stop_codon:yes gene_type:complete